MRTTILTIVFCVFLLFGCEEQPYDLSALPTSGERLDTLGTIYLEQGEWTGFNRPSALIYGRDQLFYVADTYNNRILMLDQSGRTMSSLNNILHPIALAQDPRLDLLIGAETISGGDTIGVVLRVKLAPANHNLSAAQIDTIFREPARPNRRYVGIAVLPNDEYLVVRDGPDNISGVDPDAIVLRFRYKHVTATARVDTFISSLLGFLQSGSGGSYTNVNHPTGIAAFPGRSDFILIQKAEGVQFSAIWMVYSKTYDFEGWTPKFDLSLPDDRSNDFVKPNRFSEARGVVIDRLRSDIYIVDAAQDSVVKFSSRGVFKAESFGARSPRISLEKPQSVAIAEKTLYVCDTGRNRIVLYKLSTDLQ